MTGKLHFFFKKKTVETDVTLPATARKVPNKKKIPVFSEIDMGVTDVCFATCEISFTP